MGMAALGTSVCPSVQHMRSWGVLTSSILASCSDADSWLPAKAETVQSNSTYDEGLRIDAHSAGFTTNHTLAYWDSSSRSSSVCSVWGKLP